MKKPPTRLQRILQAKSVRSSLTPKMTQQEASRILGIPIRAVESAEISAFDKIIQAIKQP